jgi:hypothetical protein
MGMLQHALDPTTIYRAAYYAKLNNQISVIAGKYIPVYDRVPNDATAPFIILSSSTLTPILNTTGYGYSATIMIDVVTRFQQGGGKKLADDISNEVFKQILTRENFYTDDVFNIYTSKLDSTRIIESESNGGYVIRKLITFENKIQQLA